MGRSRKEVGSVVPLAALLSVLVVYVCMPATNEPIPIHWRCIAVYLERTTLDFGGDSTVGTAKLE